MDVFLGPGGFQRLGNLVGAGGGLPAAADALQPLNGLLHRHPLQQAGDTLEIAVTAPTTWTD